MTLKIVKDDTPSIVINLRDNFDNPVDVSAVSTDVNFKVRLAGSTSVKATVVCTKAIGLEDVDGTIDVSAPYNVAGAGGKVVAMCPNTVFDVAGSYESEIEVSYNSGTSIKTVYKTVRIIVREDF
jgi:hypothetical protein